MQQFYLQNKGHQELVHLKNMMLPIASQSSFRLLPVPVAAQAQISFPSRPTGIQAFWIGVGCLKPRAVIACQGNRIVRHQIKEREISI